MKEEQKILRKIVKRVWADESFKNDLMTNPVETIERHFEVKVNLPEGKRLIIKDQTNKDNVYINLPTEPSMESMELTEGQLESIAGGIKIDFNQMIGGIVQQNILEIIKI